MLLLQFPRPCTPHQRLFCPLAIRNRPFDAAPKLGAAVEILLGAKRSAGRRTVYLRSLEHYLNRFASGRESTSLSVIGHEHVERYLESFTGHSRATHLNRISTLFSFAARRGWIRRNPCDRVERGMIDRKTPRILTPTEAQTLITAAGTLCRPFFVLALYCGIRPAEVARLNWEDINLETKTVTINAAASKVRQRRIVSIPDVAVKWLAGHPLRSGPVTPSESTLRRCKRKARAILGWWQADCLRHTALSYHLALIGDVGKVATMAGNSPKVLLTHYNGLASKEDAEQFFKA